MVLGDFSVQRHTRPIEHLSGFSLVPLGGEKSGDEQLSFAFGETAAGCQELPDVRRKMLDADKRRQFKKKEPLDHVLEFADIARPVVFQESSEVLLGEFGGLRRPFLGEPSPKLLNQEGNVFFAFA